MLLVEYTSGVADYFDNKFIASNSMYEGIVKLLGINIGAFASISCD